MTVAFVSSKMTLQPSSHNYPADKSEALFKLSRTYLVFAALDSKGYKFISPLDAIVPLDLSGNPTYDVGIFAILVKHRASSDLIYVLDALLSSLVVLLFNCLGPVKFNGNSLLIKSEILLLLNCFKFSF